MSLKEKLKIDKYSLDDEWVRNSQDFHDYSIILIKSEKRRDLHKDKIEFEKAELDKNIRNNPALFGIAGKPTETGIKNIITTDERIIKLQKEFHDLVEEVKIDAIAVKMIEKNSYAINGLTDLQLQGYYSSKPNNSINEKNIKKEIRKKLKNKRKEI